MDTTRGCSIEGCERPRKYRNHCAHHYQALYRTGQTPPRITLAEKFWPKVDRDADGCWEYLGHRDADGYGKVLLTVPGRRWQVGQRAHRIAWELTHGPIPDGMLVRHHCDNPPCCRPDHLALGTPADNMIDRSARDRAPWGERHVISKLTAEQVRAIRAQSAAGRPFLQIAPDFGIHPTQVANIVYRRSWAHLT